MNAGRQLAPGDRVRTTDGLSGIVVCNMESGAGSADFPYDEWAYLGGGVMVMTDEIGLVHYEDASDLVPAAAA